MYYQAENSDNIQAAADGTIQTLYLMNPNYLQGYTDTQQQQQQHHQQSSNMIFLNGHALNTASITHAPLQQPHHFVGVPLPSSDDQNHGLIQRSWGGNGTHQSQIPSSTVVSANSCGGTTTDFASQLGFQRPIPVSPPQQQQQGSRGLSLSLSPHQQINIRSLPIDHQVGAISSSSPSTNIRGLDGISSMILGSKYLKAAQEILDEVVNVGKISIKGDGLEGVKEKGKMNNESMPLASDHVDTTSGGESSRQKNGVAELTTAQRQELQMKKAKLVSMLEEVEQRYRQYHHQMQIIISSFEQVAGIGSAKSYTQLALHAISKQFRCLKDAIVGQIKATSKNLGEEEGLLEGKVEGSRLKYVDHHLRQQRALQQLGMMQPNAWRPQRGLPERAVSVLRAWLFEHFLHPYPKDSDKIMLAKQTGLTRSQVSNWFINARVRLWKPMVEEMYLEEVKNNQDSNSSQENKNNNDDRESNKEILVPKSSAQQENNKPSTPTEISTSTTISTSPNGGSTFQAQAAAGFSFNIGSLNMESTSHDDQENNAKKPRHHHDMQINSPSSILSIDHHMETKAKGFNPLMAAYTMGEFGRFHLHDQQMASNFHANGVSLTLGLPPSENLAIQGSHQQNYLSNQNIDLGNSHYSRMSNPQANTHPNISYEDIDFQSGKRFPTQLLPDFVA